MGAGSIIGMTSLAKAAPDGYTIGVGTAAGLAINPAIMKEARLQRRQGFRLSSPDGSSAQLACGASVRAATNLPEFIAWVKANPGEPYATSGIGSSQHLCGEMLMQATGIKMTAVAYRASNLQMQDLVAGQIRIGCDNFSSAWEQVKAGKIRALAITSAKRYSFAPDIPTLAETLKDFEVKAWFGWIAPIGVPKVILDKLTAELNAVGQEPDVRKRLDTFAVGFSGLSSQAFADFARKERETLAPSCSGCGSCAGRARQSQEGRDHERVSRWRSEPEQQRQTRDHPLGAAQGRGRAARHWGHDGPYQQRGTHRQGARANAGPDARHPQWRRSILRARTGSLFVPPGREHAGAGRVGGRCGRGPVPGAQFCQPVLAESRRYGRRAAQRHCARCQSRVGGPFLSPFSNLSFLNKARVFAALEGNPASAPIAGVLPLIVGFLSYVETAVFNPVTRTISGRPIGWNLSNYPGVADGRNDFKGYFKNRREAPDTRS